MPKLFAILFSLVPLGVGLSVLGLVWSEPFGGFGSIPIFMRLFASCIASAFVLVGVGGIYSALTGGPLEMAAHNLREAERQLREQGQSIPSGEVPSAVPSVAANYACPNCGATLGDRSDVSPHGDAKCGHCNRWFNVHSRAAR